MDTSAAFGADPVDGYSEPLSKRSTLLGQLFKMPVRTGAIKPNRSLTVVWDERRPLVGGFENRYSYLVRFGSAGAVAGNHYHLEKDEIFHAATGAFRAVLEHCTSGQREEIELDSQHGTFLFVPRGIAHAIQALVDGSVLVTIASHANLDSDSFRHQIMDPPPHLEADHSNGPRRDRI